MMRGAAWVTIWLALTTSIASAQDIPLWGHKIIGQIYATQFNNGCFGKIPETPSVYFLGVIPSDRLLNEQNRVELVSRLESILSAQGNIRFRSAGAFQPIAHSTGAGNESKRTELRKLVQGASDADLTILLRPYAKRGANIDIRVMFWARDGRSDARKLTCTPAISVTYKTGTKDTACETAWKRATRANTVSKYQGFIDYLGHCPQVDEAQNRITTLQTETQKENARATCKSNLTAARQENSSIAYERYLEKNSNCPNTDIVYARLNELRQRERETRKSQDCVAAFRVARTANTPAAFDAYISANTDCPQHDAAIVLRDALIVHKNAQDTLQNARKRANSSSGTKSTTKRRTQRNLSCSDLWYQRNLIFHNNGYRFSTSRGRRAFGTGGYTRNPKLSKNEKRRVNQIKRLERQNGC